jgi:acetyl-CoA synthetase
MTIEFPVPEHYKKHTLLNDEQYQKMYQESVEQPEKFWQQQAQRIDWFTPFTKVKNTQYTPGNIDIKWFEDGQLNVSYNCIDRHLKDKADQTALIWEGDEGDKSAHISYQTLHDEVARLANILKDLGVSKGDRVAIYMPMIPEAVYAMLACTRIGAVHSVIFAGFSPNAIADRINDCQAKVMMTCDEGLRGGQVIPLKANIDEALMRADTDCLEAVLCFKYTHANIAWHDGTTARNGKDVCWQTARNQAAAVCEPEVMNAEDPLFILYTSGSTGKPKGVLHTTGGYIVYASMTHQYVFDCQPGDIYWCGADVGWITGHSYLVYGPLANGVTTVVFEGTPVYPSVSRLSEVVDKHQINILYTAPTAIRALMAKGDVVVEGTSRNSLRLMGSVGEPINPEAWLWYNKTIGNEQCPIVDTWWQTETGGIMITPLPGATTLKPGSATRPFFGVQPALLSNEGDVLTGAAEGNLAILDSWPGQARTLYGDHERFEQTYFSTYPGRYFSGDGARRDKDGYYWITGRVDDVLNVSGHRLGTAEIESALVAHPATAEAAVVGYPHDIKGQGIYAYIIAKDGVAADSELTKELQAFVAKELSPIAKPDLIQWVPGLPKTRSGKIMRRILRKIAANEYEQLGDTSTLADPSVVKSLITDRLNK